MTPQTGIAIQTTPRTATLPTKITGPDLNDRIHEVFDSIAKRAFEIFESKGRETGRDKDDWFRAESELLYPVRMDISENDQDIIVVAEVPGFNAKDLQLNIEANRLTLTGKRESKKEEQRGHAVMSECTATQILREIELPASVDSAKAIANLKDGVLTIEMPKISAKPLRAEAKSA